MKFKDYINEKKLDMELVDIVDKIKTNCQPYLNLINETSSNKELYNKLFYSGRKTSVLFLEKSIRKDRKPRDTNIIVHKYLDELFHKKFGIKLRSESLFVTQTASYANSYGEIYLIFPIDDFDYYSSDYVQDLYVNIKNIIMKISIYGKEKNILSKDFNPKNNDATIKELIKHDELKNMFQNELKKLVREIVKNPKLDKIPIGHEILLVCNKYYMVNLQKISKKYNGKINNFYKELEIK